MIKQIAKGMSDWDAQANANFLEAETRATSSEELTEPLNYSNAAAHNAIYRGKYLGSTLTDEQSTAIKAGTFDNLYIGDYWTINGVNYRIADFDYFLNTGDTACTTHHAVVVPDTVLYNAQMNLTNITDGAYVGSVMYTENLEQAKTQILEAFGSSHVLSKRLYLNNAVVDGHVSAGAWFDSVVDLMTEHMVYGNGVFSPVSTGTVFVQNHRIEKSQLALFRHNPRMINTRQNYWLRDVLTAATFAIVNSAGLASAGNASTSNGVRPAFLIS